jgi:hypothetical protein
MKPDKKSIQNSGLKLDPKLLKGWEQTVLKLARKPRGHAVHKGRSAEERLRNIMVHEMNNIQELWDVFNIDRRQINRYLSDPKKQAVAYLIGFHLANMARLQMVLERSESRHNVFNKLLSNKDRTFEIYDFGCGTGAMALTMAQSLIGRGLPAKSLKVNLYDIRKAFVDSAKLGFEETFGDDVALRSEKNPLEVVFRNLTKIKTEKREHHTDIFLFGYVWNELMRSRTEQNFAKRFLKHIKGTGQSSVVILLDSANQSVARETMELRDDLINYRYNAVYPCPSPTMLCPMLERSKDWCYSEARWELPPAQQWLDWKMEINHQVFSTGGYLFTSDDLRKTKDNEANTLVVVGRPTVKTLKHTYGKDQAEYLLCTTAGLTKEKAKGTKDLLLRGILKAPMKVEPDS